MDEGKYQVELSVRHPNGQIATVLLNVMPKMAPLGAKCAACSHWCSLPAHSQRVCIDIQAFCRIAGGKLLHRVPFPPRRARLHHPVGNSR